MLPRHILLQLVVGKSRVRLLSHQYVSEHLPLGSATSSPGKARSPDKSDRSSLGLRGWSGAKGLARVKGLRGYWPLQQSRPRRLGGGNAHSLTIVLISSPSGKVVVPVLVDAARLRRSSLTLAPSTNNPFGWEDSCTAAPRQ